MRGLSAEEGQAHHWERHFEWVIRSWVSDDLGNPHGYDLYKRLPFPKGSSSLTLRLLQVMPDEIAVLSRWTGISGPN